MLKTAMLSYWQEGPTEVPIGEICRRSGASKPALYREFGSDDGLKNAVLDAYRDLMLAPIHEILAGDIPFDQALDALIEFVSKDRSVENLPEGCLFVAMRMQQSTIGDLTNAKVEELHDEMIGKYCEWIERAKSEGKFSSDIPTEVAAYHLCTQSNSALWLAKTGLSHDLIKSILQLAFAPLR
ncbi:TetR/AcrR family transcriptional regulator [Monaibacterium marinum]|uniref:TetR/AcrR family transcriptional regulator n=1 Tax=Pontivivens marinum TaxID=1690039 RepID=UPI001FEC875E|nr:TetR/AcrR family transcriptional regulator [Monaibacterium marinum]